MKNILVVGDWLVDEHWVTGAHRSSTSSRTGDAHYRSLHSLKSTVESFCGAGLTSSLLYNIKEGEAEEYKYNIFGIGLWHEDDTEALQNMFEPGNLQERTPYRITPKKNITPVDRVKLFNLHDILGESEKKRVCTTRILRIYDAVSSDDVQFQRIDWELPLPGHEKQDMTGHAALINESGFAEKMNSFIEKVGEEIDIVIIKDLCKGVVTRLFIEFLAEKYKTKDWYVFTKAWNPLWLEELKKVNLKLFLIPQVAARTAIKTEIEKPISCWLTPSGKPDLMLYNNKYPDLQNSSHLPLTGPQSPVNMVVKEQQIL